MDQLIDASRRALSANPPVISVRNLSFAFHGADSWALRNISLDIHSGEFVLLAGPSGCGKSTLVRALSGHIPHVIEGRTEGSVRIDGADLRQLDLSDIAARVSLCQQDPEAQFCTLTVCDETAFGPENLALPAEEVKRRVTASLDAVDCMHLAERDLLHLSGGEQQRVAIASMLAMEPEVLILDEPTSSLGPDAAIEVWAAIERLRVLHGTTLIVVEHKYDRLLHLANRMIVMDRGEIVLDGDPDSVHRQYTERFRPSWPALVSRPPAPQTDPPPVLQTGPSPDLQTESPPGHQSEPQTGPRASATARAAVRVRDLSFSYANRQVLRGISFDAAAGEFVGIVGSNGSGKTTFLNCLAGLNRPFSGEVEVEGSKIARTRVSDLARKVGFVFQSPSHQLFESTIAEEVTFAGRNFGIDCDADAQRLMGEYGFTGRAHRHPHKLSHGEKRRLNLCSILPHQPQLILLDEPFIGQDAVNSARILEDILRLKDEGRTILMVAHDMEIVYRYCDRVALFDAGRILVDASPAAAMGAIAALGKSAFLPGRQPS